jgi:DNA-directed RNA polymerase subunit M/transcription elongation factor TFIIS
VSNTFSEEVAESTSSEDIGLLAEYESKSESTESIESDEECKLWINFNLACIKETYGIELNPNEFYNNNSNSFFETEVFSGKNSNLNSSLDIEDGLEQCPICSSFKILSEQVQKRSADEGMTNIFKCSKCNWIWEN